MQLSHYTPNGQADTLEGEAKKAQKRSVTQKRPERPEPLGAGCERFLQGKGYSKPSLSLTRSMAFRFISTNLGFRHSLTA